MSKPLHPRLANFGSGLVKQARLQHPKRLPFHVLEWIMYEVNDLGEEMMQQDTLTDTEWCKDFTLYEMKIEANGCGPCGWKCGIVKTLDRPFWLFKMLTLRKACIGHDILYAIGGNEIARLWADNWLHDDIVWRCRRRFASLWMSAIKAAGYVTANGFYTAVRAGGYDAFNLWTKNYDIELHMTVAS